MRSIFVRILILLVLLNVWSDTYAQTFTWKANSVNNEWEDPLNWTPSSSTPVPVDGNNRVVFSSSDNIVIVASTNGNAPVISTTQTIGALTVSSGSLTISSGITLNVTGACSIAAGTTLDGSGLVTFGSVSNNPLTIGSVSSGATVNCSLSGNVSSLYLRNNTFGSISQVSLKVFNSSGYYQVGGNVFNGPVTFETAGNSGLKFSEYGEDQFNNDLTMISTVGLIYTSYNYNTTYKGNIVVKSTGLGVYFGNPSAASLITSTLIAGKTITADNFTSGVLTLKNFIQEGSSTPQTIILGGTADCVFSTGTGATNPLTVFESEVTVSAPFLHLNGGWFKENATFTTTRTSNSTGGNIFEKACSFTYDNSTAGANWVFNGSNHYKGDATFINNNVGTLMVVNGTATFEGNAVFDNKLTGAISIANATGSVANFTDSLAKIKLIARAGTIKLTENGTANLYSDVEVNISGGTIFTAGNLGKTYLKSGRKISIGEDPGFTQGTLELKSFIQEGKAAQRLVLPCDSSNTNIFLRAGCDFSGPLTVAAHRILLTGGIYRDTTDISMCYTSTTNINNQNTEAITFKGETFIRNKGAGRMNLGYGAPDITFEGNTNFFITGSGSIALSSANPSKTVFSGTDKKVVVNIFSENNGQAGLFYFGSVGHCEINSDVEILSNAKTDIVFGSSTTGSSELAEGKSLSIKSGEFSYGSVVFRKFIQYGNTIQNLYLTGSTTMVWIDPGVTFEGDLNVSASRVVLNGGSVFKGNCFFEKTGGTNDTWKGGNEFYQKVTIKSSGSSYIMTGHSGPSDHFFDDVTFWNTSTGGMHVSHTSNTQFDGDIVCTNTGAGNIIFGNGVGVSTLSDGKKILTEDFISGGLTIKNFKQLDSTTAQNILMDSLGTGILIIGPGTEFNGPFTAYAPNFRIGGIYRGIASFTKTGTDNSSCFGDTYFYKDVVFNNHSNGRFYIGEGTWNFYGNVTFNNTIGSIFFISSGGNVVTNFNGVGKLVTLNNVVGQIFVSSKGTCNFNSDILLLNFTNTGGIYFAHEFGKVYLSSTTHITNGSYNVGILSFRGTIQSEGSPDIELDLSGAKIVIENECKIFSKWKSISSILTIRVADFYDSVEFIVKNDKTGNNSASLGGATFHSYFRTINEGPQGLGFNSDVFKGDAVFVKSGTGVVNPSYSGTSEYYGDIIYDVGSGLTPNPFGGGGGKTIFKGGKPQTVSSNYGNLIFTGGGIEIEKSANHVTLNTSFMVNSPIKFTKGNFITSPGYHFRINNPVNISGASSQSHIEGLARKYGNGAFTFPIGKNGKYRPVTISDPVSAVSDIYVEYFDIAPSGTTLTAPLKDISECEFWNINTATPSGYYTPYSVTLGWDTDGCTPINPNVITVARYVSGAWSSEGYNNVTLDYDTGTVTSNVTNFLGNYDFTLGYRSKVFINTRNVNHTTFKVPAGAEKFNTSEGFMSGYFGTNNGIVKIHPDLNSSDVVIEIEEGVSNVPYTIKLGTDGASEITSVYGKKDGVFHHLSNKLYRIAGDTVIFYRDIHPSVEQELLIRTNLEGGLVFRPSNAAPDNVFKVTVPNNTTATLEVLNASGIPVYPESSNLEWDGRDTNGNTCPGGTYRYNVKLNDSVYQGQLILKN